MDSRQSRQRRDRVPEELLRRITEAEACGCGNNNCCGSNNCGTVCRNDNSTCGCGTNNCGCNSCGVRSVARVTVGQGPGPVVSGGRGRSRRSCGNNTCGNNNSCIANYNGIRYDTCDPLAMVYPVCQQWQEIYELADGFPRGTVFRELDMPFYPTPCNNQCGVNTGGINTGRCG